MSIYREGYASASEWLEAFKQDDMWQRQLRNLETSDDINSWRNDAMSFIGNGTTAKLWKIYKPDVESVVNQIWTIPMTLPMLKVQTVGMLSIAWIEKEQKLGIDNCKDIVAKPTPILNNNEEQIKLAIETMMDEGVFKNSYDFAFVMQLMNETDGLPRFDSAKSFLTYISDLGIDGLPGEDSIKKKLSATFGKYPAWWFNDQKGKDATEAKRRNNVASRFLSLYRKGK